MGKYKKHTYRFVGTHPVLQYGEYYTVKQYAEAIGMPVEPIRNRFKRYTEINNVTLHPASTVTGKRCETKSEVFSQKWLRKTI